MSEPERPVLYMDFDGVLAFKGSPDKYRRRSGGLGHVMSNPNPLSLAQMRDLRWSAELVGKLRALPADWLWLTAWYDAAPRGLDPMLHVQSAGFLFWEPDVEQYGKWEALVRDQNRNPRPFVWLDDVATEFFDPSELLTWVPHLVLTPDQQVGVTRAQLEEVQAFFQEWGL